MTKQQSRPTSGQPKLSFRRSSASSAQTEDSSAPSGPDFRSLFDPAKIFEAGEVSILRAYFGLKLRKSDPPLKSLYADEKVSAGPIRLWTHVSDDGPATAVSNAVARLCLAGVQDRLPQWATVDSSGKECLGRHEFAHEPRLEALQPEQLLCINWADSGPGFSWPEEYCVTYVPGFDRYVVTASVDSTDSWGVTDTAIGFFGQDEDFAAGCERIVRDWWQRAAIMEGSEWAYLFNVGLIDKQTAYRLRREVWGGGTGPA